MEEVKSETNDDKITSRLPAGMGGGPHGLGDPDDQTLRKVELTVLIPKKVRHKIDYEKCAGELLDFLNCSKEHGLLCFIKCRATSKKYSDCSVKWFNDKELNEQCKKEYLYERTYYRKNGVASPETLEEKRYLKRPPLPVVQQNPS